MKPGQLAITSEPPASSLEQPSRATKLCQLRPQLGVESTTLAEQIRASGFLQALGDLGVVPPHCSFEGLAQRAAFQRSKPAHQRPLVSSACGDQCLPYTRKLAHGFGAEHCSPEPVVDRIEEAVALPDQAVQIGERADLPGVLGRIIGDDGQPQTQFSEAYRCGREVDAKEIPLKHGSLPVRRCYPGVHPVEALQSAQEKCA
jgi:hypothetical protein